MMDSLTGAGPEMADMPGPVRAVDTSEAVNPMNVGDAVEIGKTMPEGSDARSTRRRWRARRASQAWRKGRSSRT